MLLGFLCLLILCAAWLVLRHGVVGDEHPAAWRAPPRWRESVLGGLLVLGSSFPFIAFAPWTSGAASYFPSDAASHAKVALEIARFGLPHGWLASFMGGFPFGHHYPTLGWLLLALGMRAGVAPALAVNALGFVAIVAAPLVLFASCVRAGARPALAASAGCLLALVSPYNPFVGGFEVYFVSGLISQALALPFCIAFAAAVARGARAEAVLWSAFAMLAHPELCAAAATIVAVVALGDGARGRRGAAGCALVAIAVAGLALYGQGIATLGVPFGWPPGFNWRQLGFGTARLVWWFRDGDLLDYGASTPQLTSLSVAAVLSCALLCKRRAPRAALLLVVAGIAASSCGPALAHVPKLGGLLLEFLQPLRVLALLPPIFAVAVVVALEEGTAALRGVRLPLRLRRYDLAGLAPAAITLGVVAFALPLRVRNANEQAAFIRRTPAACGAVPGYDVGMLAEWLEDLHGGSLWFDEEEGGRLVACLSFQGLALHSSVPVGTTSAVGSHVGMLWVATKQLQPQRAGAALRAEALGIRYLLQTTKPDSPVPVGFVRRKVRGSIELLELPHGAQVHVGCVRERWSGSDRALRERLTHDLSEPATTDRLLDPERFIELETTTGNLKIESLANDCDATGAALRLLPREPGALEADVSSRAPVDVAFHATAFPSWRVSVDGATGTPPRMIAPGYFYAHVGAGRHHLVATVSSMPGYAALLVAAMLALAALAWLEPRRVLQRMRGSK